MIKLLDSAISMKLHGFWSSPSAFYSIMDDTDDGINPYQHFKSFKAQALRKLLASDYRFITIDNVIASQHHLSDPQKKLLATVVYVLETLVLMSTNVTY